MLRTDEYRRSLRLIRLSTLCTVALFTVAPMAASAGGYTGAQACAELAYAGQLHAGAHCRSGTGGYRVEPGHTGTAGAGLRGYTYRLLRHVPATEVVRGKRCPYPHRPSDSVFAGGAGYIIKDDVRARIGCVY